MFNQHPINGKFLIYGRVSTTSDEQRNSLTVQTTESDDFSLFEDFKKQYGYTCYGILNTITTNTAQQENGYIYK